MHRKKEIVEPVYNVWVNLFSFIRTNFLTRIFRLPMNNRRHGFSGKNLEEKKKLICNSEAATSKRETAVEIDKERKSRMELNTK